LWSGDRWRRRAERAGVAPEVADRARQLYLERLGERAFGPPLAELLPTLAVRVAFVHSVHDEREPFDLTMEVADRCEGSVLLRVEHLTHGRTPRDPTVVAWIAGRLTR
jgi:hypothetical protein